MQVTTPHRVIPEHRSWKRRIWVGASALAGLTITFVLDRSTGAAPVQHLYYLPIVLTGAAFGFWGGVSVAIAAIGLYPLANPHVLAFRYEQMDVVQVSCSSRSVSWLRNRE
jgi:hypothetical protein